MTALALVLSAALAIPDGGQDAGTDAPFIDADAGIQRVVSAVQLDGGLLGPGWHLTPARMQKVGEYVVAADNAKAKAERERDEALTAAADAGGMRWFLYGLAGGVVLGGTLMVVGLNAINHT